MEDTVKQFFENFIQSCENSESLDSVETTYFCNWAKMLLGKEVTPLESEKNILGVRLSVKDEGQGFTAQK